MRWARALDPEPAEGQLLADSDRDSRYFYFLTVTRITD